MGRKISRYTQKELKYIRWFRTRKCNVAHKHEDKQHERASVNRIRAQLVRIAQVVESVTTQQRKELQKRHHAARTGLSANQKRTHKGRNDT